MRPSRKLDGEVNGPHSMRCTGRTRILRSRAPCIFVQTDQCSGSNGQNTEQSCFAVTGTLKRELKERKKDELFARTEVPENTNRDNVYIRSVENSPGTRMLNCYSA